MTRPSTTDDAADRGDVAPSAGQPGAASPFTDPTRVERALAVLRRGWRRHIARRHEAER